MFKNIFIFGFFTAISRIAGLIRDILIAVFIGTTTLAEVFFSSFRFINLFRAIFAEGAFTISFIPIYSAELYSDKKAFSFASSIISITFIILLILCIVIETTFSYIIQVFTPGFDQSRLALMTTLSRIMMPYIIFISLVSLIGSMLQVKQHFISTAIAPIILNICLTISLFMPYIKTPVHNLSIAVLIGGIFQLILMLFSAYKLKAYFFFSIKLSNKVKLFFKRVIPIAINNGVIQISLWIDTIIASFIPNALSYIYYADRINQLPKGVIGTAIGVVLLPLISKEIDNIENVSKVQSKALIIGLILVMPVVILFVLVPEAILLTIFSYGKFDYYAVQQTAPTLTALSLSLPAFIINKVLLQKFFINGNFKIPMMVSLACLGVNTTLDLLLIDKYQHTGIAIATSISTWINSISLIYYLVVLKMYKFSQALLIELVKIVIAMFFMSAVLYFSNLLLVKKLFINKIFTRILYLGILSFLSLTIYFSVIYLVFRRSLNI